MDADQNDKKSLFSIGVYLLLSSGLLLVEGHPLHRRPAIGAYRDHDGRGRFDRKNDHSLHERHL
jgi:hypothetical protein